MRTLYLIDAYAQFFRAFHAIRTPMSSPVTHEPTNMTFGFVGMLLKLLRGQEKRMLDVGGRPTYLAVALDVSGDRGTFRSTLFPEYKATRPPPPEGLKPQVERCLALLRAINVPVLGAEGFEADDIVATIAQRLRSRELLVRAVSKDKDLKQLLHRENGGGFEIYDVHNDETFGQEELLQATGLKPAQVVDMLALMGDSVDNVPGVDGVGEKTAAMLVAQFGSIEGLLADVDKIKGKRGEKIREAAGQLDLSRKLVTLDRDVNIAFELEQASIDRIDLTAMLPILQELGFHRYQDEVKKLISEGVGIAPRGAEAGKSDAAAGDAGPLSLFAARRSAERHERTTEPPADARTKASHPNTSEPHNDGLFADIAARDEASNPRGASVADRSARERGTYECVVNRQQLAQLVRELDEASVVAIDTETTSVSPMRAQLCGLSFAVRAGHGWYVPVRSPTPEVHLDETTVLDALRPIIENPRKPKVGHNLKYDLLVLRAAGAELRGIADAASGAAKNATLAGIDTMTASWLDDATRSSYAMDAVSLAYLDYTPIPISDLIGSGARQRSFQSVPIGRATEYAAEDADITLRLASVLRPRLRAGGLDHLASRVEMPLVEVLAELEWNGVLVDAAELERQRSRLQAQIDILNDRLQSTAMETCGRTFDPDSPKQLGTILFNRPDASEPGLGLRPYRRGKTGPSTDAETLERLVAERVTESPIPKLILEYRQLTKLVSTYLVALKEAIHPTTGRVHTSFHQTGAATGRLSSSDPNLQNIPIRSDIGREIRKAFVAPPGKVLITADYSQIELRLLAHLSRDPNLIEAFERGEDIHASVAAQVNGVPIKDVTREMRSRAKAVNFGIVYGITGFGLARQLDIGQAEAQAIIDDYKRRFAGITTFMQECIEQVERYGYVTTMLGRRRAIRGLDSGSPAERALAERVAINSVVQGSAADLIKLAMVDLHRRLSEHAAHWRSGAAPELPGVRMLLQIHDELLFESEAAVAERARALIVDRMENAMEDWAQLRVPIKVDSAIATNWFEGK